MKGDSPLLLLDFDGPVVDVSPRYHQLHTHLVSRYGGTPLARDEYWAGKRARVPEIDLLRRTDLTPAAVELVATARHELIETQEWVAKDRAWPWASPSLARLRGAGWRVVVVTQRNLRHLVEWQLKRFGLDGSIDRLLVGRGDNTPTAKVGVVRAAGFELPGRVAFVGDTETDVCSGRVLGAETVAVRSGIRDDASLLAHDPDHIVDNLQHAVDHLLGASQSTSTAASPDSPSDHHFPNASANQTRTDAEGE